MASTTWTTTGVFTGPGGVLTGEAGTLTGELTVRTTWEPEQAHVAVQYVGASEWCTLTGSPVPCPTPEVGRAVHQCAVEAVRTGGAVPFAPWPAISML
ncbi:hypothetical protein [Streptomyces sp. NBC_01233]|uniref:hypothetical protein n=1 Tax=Streptomyces sp. NBC_01233 TaxID=2903787 RepID=UPI002E1322AE|nr:hypothetical protein OG332_43400 [Streptomyces sp. NBC_01233]